jgi:hypothetical protein
MVHSPTYLLSCLDALRGRQINLSSDGIFRPLDTLRNLVVGELLAAADRRKEGTG